MKYFYYLAPHKNTLKNYSSERLTNVNTKNKIYLEVNVTGILQINDATQLANNSIIHLCQRHTGKQLHC